MDKQLIEKMKSVLGSVFALYYKTHVAHWNVEGIQFMELHGMFQTQYEDLWESVDDIAEQIRQLDAYVPQSLSRINELSDISDMGSPPFVYSDLLNVLKEDHEAIIKLMTEANELAQKLNKQGLSNYLCGRIEQHSKFRWMLRASSK